MSDPRPEPEGPTIGVLLLKAAGLGLFGLVAIPAVTFAAVLGLSYAFGTSCGMPGDSGGCEMGAAALAFAVAVPGFLLFFFVTLIRALRRRERDQAEE
jgi:pilus assembly protein TadC